MMNDHSYVRWLLVAIVSFVGVGCGGGGDETAPAVKSSEPAKQATGGSSEGDALKSLTGRAVRATDTAMVISGADGEEVSFTILPEDRASVDPAHVQSHVGVPDLAFRVMYYEQDGERLAIAAEEVSASELG